jgi:RNA polymerase sigma-70 factor (ECF subfamily)
MRNGEIPRLYERLLVLRCQTGDERAFAELIERYNPRLLRFLRQMLGDVHTADDTMQDVWLEVFRNIAKLRDTGTFSAWLYRIAHRRVYRLLRRRRPRPASLDDADSAPAPQAADLTLNPEERRIVQLSLQRLPHWQREVLLLRFFDELSYEQIAAAIGCELGTVRSRLHYAKRALRGLIEGSNDEQHP